jgi:phosphatidylglycerophosphate synthase
MQAPTSTRAPTWAPTRALTQTRRRAPLGPALGLLAQAGLLTALSVTVGIGVTGWVTGVGVPLVGWGLLHRGLARAGAARLGAANTVTLARAVLIGGVAALAARSLNQGVPVGVIVVLTGVALALDAVDGQVARRTGTATPLGARFDMEADAFLLLVLSVLMVRPAGAWVLAIGGMRYAYVAAGMLLPWLTGALPPRFSRKVVAAVQGVVLVVAVAGVLPAPAVRAALAAALAALLWSFGRDALWSARHRRPTGSARSAERVEKAVPEGVHAPDRRLRSRAQAVLPAPR